MKFERISTRHLVKGEDLNHHGTLYAGRGVEWMVEAGFIAASSAVKDPHVVCMRINSLLFRRPVPKGQIVLYEASIVYVGKSSMVAYVKVTNSNTDEFIVDGFFTYVYVNETGKSVPHNLTIEPSNDEERKLYEQAHALMQESKSGTR